MPARDVARGDDAGGRGQGGQVKRAGADVDGEPAERADGSELMYQRNRYHDPASGRFTQQDPIGLAGGSNLYGFAGSDQLNYSDPFGLCKDAKGQELPASQCRDVSAAEGKSIGDRAQAGNDWIYSQGRNDAVHGHEPRVDLCRHVGDCTSMVEQSQREAGLPAIDPRTPTAGFEKSTDYRQLAPGEAPQRGDVVVQGKGAPSGHAGIVTGGKDSKGRNLAYSNGSHGNKVIPFGKGVTGLAKEDPRYFRRQVPR